MICTGAWPILTFLLQGGSTCDQLLTTKQLNRFESFSMRFYSLRRDGELAMRLYLPFTLPAGLVLLALIFSLSNLTCSGDPISSGGGGTAATERWSLISPYPTASTIYGVTFTDDRTCWAVGEGGVVLKSTDAGDTWSTVDTDYRTTLWDIAFADPRHGWAVGDDGLILHTRDGGRKWSEQRSGTVSNLSAVDFPTPSRGWAVGYDGIILETGNGGVDWRRRTDLEQRGMRAVHFTNANHGCIVGNDFIFTTFDGGRSWSRFTCTADSLDNVYLETIDFVGNDSGIAVGLYDRWGSLEGYRALTIDGGQTWDEQRTRLLLSSVSVTTTGAIVATGLSYVQRSYDWGQTWEEFQISPPSVHATALSSSGVLLAAGYRGEMKRSSDNGSTFERISYGPRPFLITDVRFTTQSRGFLTEQFGEVLATEDGGQTWLATSVTDAHDIVEFVDEQYGWVADNNGRVFRTTDGGDSWGQIVERAQGKLLDLNMVDSLTGWLCGHPGIMHTEDGGSTWETKHTVSAPNMQAVALADSSTVWVVGDHGTIVYTNDAVTWQRQVSGTNEHLTDAQALDNSVALCVGNKGTVLHTTDAGVTWNAVKVGTTVDLSRVQFVDMDRGWITGVDGTILTTSDGGDTWRKQRTEGRHAIRALFMLDGNTGWTGGDNGEIMRIEP